MQPIDMAINFFGSFPPTMKWPSVPVTLSFRPTKGSAPAAVTVEARMKQTPYSQGVRHE